MLKPGPWKRGTNIEVSDEGYVTRSRCKTGFKIKRCCSRCGKWELWRHAIPLSGRYDSWSDARDAFVAETHGRHDKMAIDFSVRVAVRVQNAHKHRPHPDRWDAEWLLWPQRFMLGFDCGMGLGDFAILDQQTGMWQVVGHSMHIPTDEDLGVVMTDSVPDAVG